MSGVDVEAGMVGYTGAVLEHYFSGHGCYEARRRSSNLTRQGCLPVQAGRYLPGRGPPRSWGLGELGHCCRHLWVQHT